MNITIHKKGKFKYVDEGRGKTIVLLHGLFGILSNWQPTMEHFCTRYRIVIPILPIYDASLKRANMHGLLAFFKRFVSALELQDIVIAGNSLGGHLGLLYTLDCQDNVSRLILTGSSGLYENAMGGIYLQRKNYAVIKDRVEYTFYDPRVASKALIDSVFDALQDTTKCMSLIFFARSAQRNNLAKELPGITIPTLLIWGLNDTITPPLVAHDFNRLIPNSELKFIDRCCHAPMMEHPQQFNALMETFLSSHHERL